jgi:hypothetical protein
MRRRAELTLVAVDAVLVSVSTEKVRNLYSVSSSSPKVVDTVSVSTPSKRVWSFSSDCCCRVSRRVVGVIMAGVVGISGRAVTIVEIVVSVVSVVVSSVKSEIEAGGVVW